MKANLSVPESLEAELLRQLARVHGVGQVLLVGEHQEGGVSQLVFLKLKGKKKMYQVLFLDPTPEIIGRIHISLN